MLGGNIAAQRTGRVTKIFYICLQHVDVACHISYAVPSPNNVMKILRMVGVQRRTPLINTLCPTGT